MHTQTATTLAGSPGILSRAHGGQLCAVSASCLSICSPQPRDACRSLRASARKEPQNPRKVDERVARWKLACGNKRVPWGEDRGQRKRVPSVVAEKEVAAEHTGGARSLPRRRWQRAARAPIAHRKGRWRCLRTGASAYGWPQ